MDEIKSLGTDKSLYEIPRTEWTDGLLALQDGVNNMTVESYCK